MTEDPARIFRNVMSSFATGVTLVTASWEGTFTALTINSFSSVSLQPLLVLVCVDLTAESHPFIAGSQAFAVNILGDDQEQVSRVFATKDPGKDAALRAQPHHAGASGSPILDRGLGFFDCRVVQEIHAGDHTIFIGEVIDFGGAGDGDPLLFFRGAYRALAVSQAAG